MAKGLDSKKTNVALNSDNVQVLNVDVDTSVEVVKEKERINYTREQQMELFGYITARDLTKDEVKSLPTIDLLVSVETNDYNGVIRTVYKCRALFTNRLIVNVNFSTDPKKPKYMDEKQFNTFAGIFNLDTEKHRVFQIKVPFRLFKGIAKKQVYYQYELIIAKSLTRTKVVRQFFDNDQVILIEYNDKLLSMFFERKTIDGADSVQAVGEVDE